MAALVLATLCSAEAADLTTTTGRVYRDYTVKRIEHDGIVIRHEEGVAKLYRGDLPRSIVSMFRDEMKKAAEVYQVQQSMRAQADLDGRLREITLKKQRIIVGQVAQVYPEMFLITHAKMRSSYNPEFSRYREIVNVDPSGRRTWKTLCIAAPASGLTDGDTWKGQVYERGTMSYRAIDGSRVTVPCFGIWVDWRTTSSEILSRIDQELYGNKESDFWGPGR